MDISLEIQKRNIRKALKCGFGKKRRSLAGTKGWKNEKAPTEEQTGKES